MSNWICPDCNGGFPSPSKVDDEPVCPWCGTALMVKWEPVDNRIKRISKVEKASPKDGNPDGLFSHLFE